MKTRSLPLVLCAFLVTFSAIAQQKSPWQIKRDWIGEQIHVLNPLIETQLQHAAFGNTSAYKKSPYLLDSVETYEYAGSDSEMVAIRYFDYTNQDRLANDASYFIEDDRQVGDERTTYEYGTGLYAENTYFWDQAKRDWGKSERFEIRANLGRGDTVYARLEYTWNPTTQEWDGFEGRALVDKTLANGRYDVRISLSYDGSSSSWEFDQMDSSYYDNQDRLIHQYQGEWNGSSWDRTNETKSQYTQRPNNRVRIREAWNTDSNSFVLQDSFVFTYVQDTILEVARVYGRNQDGDFDTLSYLETNVSQGTDTVSQLFYQRDTTGTGFEPFLSRYYYLDGQDRIIGIEEMNMQLNEGIQKIDFAYNGNNETIIEYAWNLSEAKWELNERQMYEYNSKDFLTLNSFYTYNTSTQTWKGIDQRTYVFANDDETVLNRTDYSWNGSTNSWDFSTKIDYTYDADNDPILVVRSSFMGGTWSVDEKDIFYYGSWTVNQDQTQLIHLQVYPNPTANQLQFSETVSSVAVFNAQGQMMLQAKNTQSVDLQNVESGIYFLHAQHNGHATRFTIVKQ